MEVKKIRNLFPEIEVSRFNLAAWQNPGSDSVVLIGREVAEAGKKDEPDVGVLKMFETDGEGNVINERVLWKPIYEGLSLEDPRALVVAEDKISIGLTAVLRDKAGRAVPFPAIAKIDYLSSWKEELPPILIVSSFGPGKNLTPVDQDTYLFRPESAEYNHKLILFSIDKQIPKKLTEIEFPKDLEWAKWRIGTTMSPIWLNANEALFLVHGITIREIDGVKKYVYSIGRAKLSKNKEGYSLKVCPEPIITPDNFLNERGEPMVQELHPELRRVVYSCGGLVKKDNSDSLFLYVNVGDKSTFEVELSLEELKKGLF